MKRIFFTTAIFSAIGCIALFYFLIRGYDHSRCLSCNVVIIVVDSLPASHVLHLGYEKETTPTLDDFAHQGISLRNATTVSPQTGQSLFSILTGIYLSRQEERTTKPPGIQTLPEILRNNGYVTAGFIGGEEISSKSAYIRRFETLLDNGKDGSISAVFTQALDWMKENSSKKLFVLIHGNDLRDDFPIPQNYKGKFFPPRDLQTRFHGMRDEYTAFKKDVGQGIAPVPEDILYWRGFYDSRVRDVDNNLSSFWKEFSETDLPKKTIVIILSDHGTELYEHQRFGSGQSLYEEQIRIPLVMSSPVFPKGKIIDTPVSTLDITPTVLDILGISSGKKINSQFQGTSLKSAINGDKFLPRDVFFETESEKTGRQYGIRTPDGWKFIFSSEGERQLYNLNSDPGETKNLAETSIESENMERIFSLEWKIRKHLEDVGADLYDL